ncbi:hypothetical protein NBO_10g0003 [Nosema bombycis CQ1]|uniref:Uncharacterized protein n=1 Tax=Nosema bombycis (strain CQ1 / CVCC 102059) TaxID=578461 RepID=R0KXS7_NOSB1|nr:hypothetical protein NBO_10g0003 [Nosema bombycis CQ1]|eukprot:EOB15012.1 hypothetical protein NBO_10g0003 [Nosema bombycis CQ1]
MLCLKYFVGLKVVLNDGDKNRLQEDLRDESPVLINKYLVAEQQHNYSVKEKIRSLKNDYLSNSYYEKTNPSTKDYQPDIVNEKFIKRLIIPLNNYRSIHSVY